MSRRSDMLSTRRASMAPALAQLDDPMLGGPGDGGGEPPANIFKTLHGLLRGRYALAIGLAIVCGLLGAVAGWYNRKPVFVSTGYIRIKQQLSTVGPDLGPDSFPLANYSSFIQLQAMRIRQPLVVGKALESRALADMGWTNSPETIKIFRRFLMVGQDGRVPELVAVSYWDGRKDVCKAAVDAVMNAYYELYGNEAGVASGEAVATLEREQAQLETAVAQISDRIRSEIVRVYGNDDPEAITQRFIEQRMRYEEAIDRIQFELAMREAATGTKPGASETLKKPDLTEDEIAAVDDRFQGLITQRTALERELQRFKDRGIGAQHPDMIAKADELGKLQTRIRSYMKLYNERAIVAGSTDRLGSGAPIETVDQLRSKLANMESLLEKCKKEAVEAGTRSYDAVAWKAELAAKRARLAGITQRLDQIRIEREGQKTGRISIESFAEPGEPKDSRPKWAAAGFAGGACLPIALIMLWGFIDQRRFRYSDEATSAGPDVPLLGILPNLPKNLADPDEAAAAAHCVHRIRSLMQIAGPAKKVYAVTSSVAGDGKTSLTLSLGLSYAASGSKTLLIDFDMIGGGLTSSLNAKTDHGLGEVVTSGVLNGHIVPTRTAGLSILPIGRNDSKFASRLSAPAVRRVLDAVRDDYDVVLIDTGPILGSLEAAFVAASADGVILVVGRGRHRSHVNQALDQLRAVGGSLVGLVFNRATSFDFRKSVTSASIRSVGVYNDDGTPSTPGRPVRRLGSLAQTIVMDVTGSSSPIDDDQTDRSKPGD